LIYALNKTFLYFLLAQTASSRYGDRRQYQKPTPEEIHI